MLLEVIGWSMEGLYCQHSERACVTRGEGFEKYIHQYQSYCNEEPTDNPTWIPDNVLI